MCRYAMARYKPHYACFHCRKTFKRRLMWDIRRGDKTTDIVASCPQCGALMASMGLDFASPKKDDVKQWEHIKNLYSVGITFHSCGCYGPGYIPNSKEALVAHLNELLNGYHHQLKFWRQRIEPQNKREMDRDQSKNGKYISQIPYEMKSKKGTISNRDAKQYWFDNIKKVEQQLGLLQSQ